MKGIRDTGQRVLSEPGKKAPGVHKKIEKSKNKFLDFSQREGKETVNYEYIFAGCSICN